MTPQAWLAWSPTSVQPIDSRTPLRAPSAPTTYFARTMRSSPSSGAGGVHERHGDRVLALVGDLEAEELEAVVGRHARRASCAMNSAK